MRVETVRIKIICFFIIKYFPQIYNKFTKLTNSSLWGFLVFWNLPNEMAQLSDKELLKQIANRIKGLRKEKGITQEAFYNDTNIHIARIEVGKTNVSVSTLNAICNYFDISLKDFFI